LVRAGMGVALIPEYWLPANADDVRCRYLSNPVRYMRFIIHRIRKILKSRTYLQF
jgi:DNA-binding transcriptional LysR family regulator